MPTVLLITTWLQASDFGLWATSGLEPAARSLKSDHPSRVKLPFNPFEQVRDVVPLEHTFAESGQDRLAFIAVGATVGAERVPARRQALQLGLMRRPLGLNRSPRALEPRLPHFGRRAAATKVAHFVELLVERKYF